MRIIDKSGGAPHIPYGVVADLDVRVRSHLLELIQHKRRDVIEILDRVGDEILLNGDQQVFLKHALDDILRRTEHIVVFVTDLDLRECGLVDVEGLIDDFYFLARLLEIPLLEALLDVLVDVVRPVEHFELMRAVRTAARSQYDGSNCHYRSNQFFHFSSCLELRMLI